MESIKGVFGEERKEDGIHYRGEVYTEGEWKGLLREADETGFLLTLSDPGSTYDPTTKIWLSSSDIERNNHETK